MKILLVSLELESLTGQPMYTYNLAKGLTELGHNVTCVGLKTGGVVTNWLKEINVRVFNWIDKVEWLDTYDLVIISEQIPGVIDNVICDNIYNLCHSKGDCDKPIEDDRIKGYLFPREQIKEHWGKEGLIVPIPLDLEKFNIKKEKQDKYTILAPCTIDDLRKPMLLNLLKRAEEGQVWIVGKDYGALKGIDIPDNVTIFPETDDVTEYMRKADEVAGIFIGTVTLEAWAMGIKTSVYDEKGNWEYVKGDITKNNYISVAKLVTDTLCKAQNEPSQRLNAI